MTTNKHLNAGHEAEVGQIRKEDPDTTPSTIAIRDQISDKGEDSKDVVNVAPAQIATGLSARMPQPPAHCTPTTTAARDSVHLPPLLIN